MSFSGSTFIFDGRASDEFELTLYQIGSVAHSEGRFAANVEFVEKVVGTKWKPHFYGIRYDEKLEFDIVFGVNQHRLDEEKYLDRYELEAVASWLVGHQSYKWLEIEQGDMDLVRYHCMVTELEVVEFEQIPWALKAKVVCDGPYAYTYPQVFEYEINGSADIPFLNISSHNGFFMPVMEFDPYNVGNFSITNEMDNGRTLRFSEMTATTGTIYVNNDTMVVQCEKGLNLYDYCNCQFLRLVKGYNFLHVTGDGRLRLICEFPINIGG